MLPVLGYVGITFILTRAGIFLWLRERGPKTWREFISCPLCTGFWVGFVLSSVDLWLYKRPIHWEIGLIRPALQAVGVGALTGLAALLVACVIDWLDAAEQLSKSLLKRRHGLPSFPDEAPTDPNGYQAPTKKVSDETISEAMRRMGEKKG
jgi:hypothetical protein